MTESCQTCKFWKPHPETAEFAAEQTARGQPIDLEDEPGACRRYPPKLDLGWDGDRNNEGPETRDNWWVFPVTTGESWCGEFAWRL